MATRRALLTSGAVAAGATLVAGAARAETTDRAAPDRHRSGEASRASRGLRTGAEVAAEAGWSMLEGSRVGVFSNPTGVLRDTRHIVDDMVTNDRLRLVAAFGPEHGFRGSAQAGGSEGDTTDPRTGIPVYDAYGADTDKLRRMFEKAELETVVFDIQDVGARFYTYIWTLYRAMVAAARLGLRFVVLDRPNPIGGRVDGAMMTPGFTSGVGLKEIVQQHGMTVGELARFYNGEFLPDEAGKPVELDVVRMKGWRPTDRAQELGLPWVPPSPNVPTPDTALVYAGTCFFEGTNLSEGRGTTRPFEFIGAPYLDYHWGDRLNARGLPGVDFREAYFTPTFNKHENTMCAGVQVHVTDVRTYRPIETAVAMLVEARKYDDFAWRQDSWDPERPFWIDKLSGSPRLRTMIDAGADVDDVVGAWKGEVADFDRRRRRYLIYPGRRG
ncbi:MAG TPA: DUF1343 domain-containing protein [Actinopolymorphaceae bacterium]